MVDHVFLKIQKQLLHTADKYKTNLSCNQNLLLNQMKIDQIFYLLKESYKILNNKIKRQKNLFS